MSESETGTSEVFTLELPDQGEARALGMMDNAWDIASKVYKLAESKLVALAASKLPPRDEVIKAAGDAYDKYVKQIEDIARDAFLKSVGALYDGVSGVVKS